MSVYVDIAIHTMRGRWMCHMFSPDLGELHAMAARIGLKRSWFQDPLTMRVSWPHYDIDVASRTIAIGFGAIACDRYQTVAMAAIIQRRPDKLRRIRALANPNNAFAPAAHVPAWLIEQGFQHDWDWNEATSLPKPIKLISDNQECDRPVQQYLELHY
ncbi:DUF4031 domain-containing protein [Gluconobacter sp. P5B12]|uniref:DUF4031 domain-containing protein n=1 Tax=unclassified Gluconobacter TaxID=2644261 RepID=UPI001C03E26B|nr:DUF4031 domain-containing protein [Gluconobacter sp. P5B12]